MRILMIYNSYDMYGGDKVYINNLSEELKKENHEIFHISDSTNISMENSHLTVIKFGFKNKYQWFLSNNLIDFNLYRQLRRHILKVRPDIIHFHNVYLATKTFLLASRGFPMVQTIHDFGVVCPLSNNHQSKFHWLRCYNEGCLSFKSFIFDYLIFNNSFWKKRMISAFICPSAKLEEECKSAGFKKTFHLPYFYRINETNDVNFGKTSNILYVGRLAKEKGIEYLLEAFKISLNNNKNLRLNIVGDGPEKNNLLDLSKKLGVYEYVNFFGKVEHEKIKNYIKDCFVVVIPSIWMENSPLVAYEAMACAKPIIASRIGGVPELVKDGFNGFLVEKFDINNLSDKINNLFENPKLAQKMGEAAKNMLLAKFNTKVHIEKIVKIYKEI